MHIVNVTDKESCVEGWILNGISCYKDSAVYETWEKAASRCESESGQLISMQSWAELEFLKEQFIKPAWERKGLILRYWTALNITDRGRIPRAGCRFDEAISYWM